MAIIRKIEEVPLEMMDCLDHGHGLGLRILLDPLLNLLIEGLTMVQTEIKPGGYTISINTHLNRYMSSMRGNLWWRQKITNILSGLRQC
jgi:hypothetical protein